MKACGLVVEYNPFHNGHVYHLEEAKKMSESDCLIAVMSGSFLQRGEPALVDKFSRTKAALESGVDIVLELPYAYSVQSSELFSHGAIKALNALKISSLCFGSESGIIHDFLNSYHNFNENKHEFNNILKKELTKGLSYPDAHNLAYDKIGFNLNVLQPNNILGFNYVKEILNNQYNIDLYTLKRIDNNYHDTKINSNISSATSIRREILENGITEKVTSTLPLSMNNELNSFYLKTNTFIDWESYFSLLQYKVLSTSRTTLSKIALVDEGIHNRIKDSAQHAKSFHHWMTLIKTKRYTWVKIQRIFTHILTSTTQSELNHFHHNNNNVRLLGMSKVGQAYLNKIKSDTDINIITSLKSYGKDSLEAKVSNIYYSAILPKYRMNILKQEYAPPIILK